MFNREKFKNLIHYVIWKIANREGFGATKLYKVLWFSEGRQFILTGNPIAGAEYIREKHGPVPKLGMVIREELQQEGRIQQWKDRRFNFETWRFKSLKVPPSDALTNDEKKVVDYWIKHIDEDHTADSISDESHDLGWEIAKMGEVLPFHAILARRLREPTEEELDWARERARELGLL